MRLARRVGAASPVCFDTVRRLVVDLVRYGGASVVALACDYGLLVAATAEGVDYLYASCASFSLGMIIAYALCVRLVFHDQRRTSRRFEAVGFFAVGIAGLLLTQLLLYLLVSKLGFAVAVAKAPTVAICFLFNFLCRRGFVFAAPDVWAKTT